ncbi:MAG: AAA family ATPase [Candidatus Eisenbacteria sp.]|nr:AAA family ATPase [Candidatus Eisenbacteria bacterium]
MQEDIRKINEEVQKESAFVQGVLAEAGRVIVGQQYMMERLLMMLLVRGHALLEGVPGLAKTLAVRVLAQIVDVEFRRIQFTPDLLPADLIGTMIFDPQRSDFTTRKGPVFTNLLLADEINRAPAKVQSALLESMQERQVTIGDKTYPLDDPFLVLATQNPIEQEGTYPLPEAQLDRFTLKLKIGYPDKQEEREIMDRMATGEEPEARKIVSRDDIVRARDVVDRIYIDPKIKDYLVEIVHASRAPGDYGLKLGDLIAYGASPRATICLNQTARAHAFLRGRGYVTPEDVKSIALDVLRHRIIPTYEAEAEEITSEEIARQILDQVEVP